MRADHFLFFFSVLGVFNGLLLATYLLWPVGGKPRAAYWLGGLVSLFVVRVGVSAAYFFEGRISWSVVQLGMLANVMIGPFLLAYVTRRLTQIPPAWPVIASRLAIAQLSILLVFGFLYPFAEHPYWWDHYLRYAWHTLLAGYFLVTAYLLWRSGNRSRRNDWLTGLVFLTSLTICLGFALSLYLNYILGPVLATLFFYAAVAAWWYRRRHPLPSPALVTPHDPADFLQLESCMERERPHVRPGLKLADLARISELPANRISKTLREHTGDGFTRYLATWRVREARRLLRERPELTVEAIGYEAGFRGRSSFFATFKAVTGESPGAYQKRESQKAFSGLPPVDKDPK